MSCVLVWVGHCWHCLIDFIIFIPCFTSSFLKKKTRKKESLAVFFLYLSSQCASSQVHDWGYSVFFATSTLLVWCADIFKAIDCGHVISDVDAEITNENWLIECWYHQELYKSVAGLIAPVLSPFWIFYNVPANQLGQVNVFMPPKIKDSATFFSAPLLSFLVISVKTWREKMNETCNPLEVSNHSWNFTWTNSFHFISERLKDASPTAAQCQLSPCGRLSSEAWRYKYVFINFLLMHDQRIHLVIDTTASLC